MSEALSFAPKFEYLIVSDKSEIDLLSRVILDKYGSLGWELVGIVPTDERLRYFFKREK